MPVCQYIPADAVDEHVVNAFFAALSEVELDAYTQVVKAQQQTDDTLERAHRQQLERLRYQVALAQRQFDRVDPDNRLVAAELEQRWEAALRELKLAEEAYAKRQHPKPVTELPKELKAAFTAIGQKLPELWQGEVLTQVQKKALLRCLIVMVVVHRVVTDKLRTRIVWKGGDTTTVDIPIPVGSLTELSNISELSARIVALSSLGLDDQTIALTLTAEGYRSPMRPTLLPSTVKRIRLEHGIMLKRSQSHPRRIAGYLTVPQIATALNFSQHWIYDRIHNGTIAITRHQETGLYLFPDQPNTLTQFQQLQAGQLQNLRF